MCRNPRYDARATTPRMRRHRWRDAKAASVPGCSGGPDVCRARCLDGEEPRGTSTHPPAAGKGPLSTVYGMIVPPCAPLPEGLGLTIPETLLAIADETIQ
jgi:hypothetical protein